MQRPAADDVKMPPNTLQHIIFLLSITGYSNNAFTLFNETHKIQSEIIHNVAQ